MPTGKDGKQLVTSEQYADLCMLAEIGMCADLEEQWAEYKEFGFGMTSDWARAFSTRIVKILDLTVVPENTIPYPPALPESLHDMWDMMAEEFDGDEELFKERIDRFAEVSSKSTEQLVAEREAKKESE